MRLGKSGRIKLLGHFVILFMFILPIFCSIIFAGEINGLREIYDTAVPAEIRRNFNEYIQRTEGVAVSEKFIDIYTKKFIVIGLTANNFGGVFADIAVEGQMRKIFRLWLYDIELGIYDLRSIAEVSGHLDEEFIKKIHTSEYSEFWL